jgi:hypothetical protein
MEVFLFSISSHKIRPNTAPFLPNHITSYFFVTVEITYGNHPRPTSIFTLLSLLGKTGSWYHKVRACACVSPL